MSRSSQLKERHAIARKSRDLYFSQYPNEKDKFTYWNFFSNDNPLKDKLVRYDVSFQVSYRGQVDAIYINPQTFTVVGFANQQGEIESRTMDMVLDSKGAITGDHLHPNTINAIGKNLKTGKGSDIDKERGGIMVNPQMKPRGMEQSDRPFTVQELADVQTSGFSVQGLDKNIKLTNKKGREGELKLDVRHWF